MSQQPLWNGGYDGEDRDDRDECRKELQQLESLRFRRGWAARAPLEQRDEDREQPEGDPRECRQPEPEQQPIPRGQRRECRAPIHQAATMKTSSSPQYRTAGPTPGPNA